MSYTENLLLKIWKCKLSGNYFVSARGLVYFYYIITTSFKILPARIIRCFALSISFI
jgi:hypothetical protein